MNNDSPIDRSHSLSFVRDEYRERGADIQKLVDEGYVTPHRIGQGGRITYTVEPEGRDLLEKQIKTGRGIGDIGDGMPHRYGADITLEWLAQDMIINDTASFIKIDDLTSFLNLDDTDSFFSIPSKNDGSIVDIIGVVTEGQKERVGVAAEIEGGRSAKEIEKYSSTSKRGLHDYASVAKDHDILASLAESELTVEQGYDAVWVVRDHQTVTSVISALHKRDCIQFPPCEASKRLKSGGIDEVNKYISDSVTSNGITAIHTFRTIEKQLE